MAKEEIQEVVFVFIKKKELLLFQKNQKWGDYSFIGGKIETADFSPLEAAYRETSEELSIVREKDYLLSQMTPPLFETQKISQRTGKLTHYKIHLFFLHAKRNIEKNLEQEGNVWILYKQSEANLRKENLSEISISILKVIDISRFDSFGGI